jgi:hypothetical protein
VRTEQLFEAEARVSLSRSGTLVCMVQGMAQRVSAGVPEEAARICSCTGSRGKRAVLLCFVVNF